MKKKSLVLMFLVLVFAIVTVAAGMEDRLVIYTAHGEEMPGDFKLYFEEAYPGVTVEFLPMGSQDMYDRAKAESNNPQADILWGGPTNIFLLEKQDGLLEKYVPSFDKYVPKEYKDADNYFYGQFLTPAAIVYNTETLAEKDVPKDWDDLLNSKYKGQITIRYPLASGTMRTVYSAMIWRYYKETGSPEKGYEWLKKLDANTKDYTSHSSVMFTNLMRGLAKLSIWNFPDAMYQKVANGYPFGVVLPKSGTPVITDNIALVKNAKHPVAAKAFIEFVGTKFASVLMAHHYFRIPVRTDINKASLPAWMDIEIVPMDIDWLAFAELSPEWMQYWDENIKGRGN